MIRMSGVVAAMALAIALYFTLSWGLDAYRTLSSPTFGLDDLWRGQALFAINRYLHLTPAGLIKLAAVFSALKLTVAAICGVHILDRARALFSGKPDSDVLEAGLMLAVSICLVALLPSIIHGFADQVRAYTIDLMFAGIAIALCIVERGYARDADSVKARRDAAIDAAIAKAAPRFHA